jgi:3-methyladenine DNA glycosylase AlkD
MTLEQVMVELEGLGSEQTRKVLRRHGLPDNAFGVKIEDLKKLLKRLKGGHALALELWETGNSDARYLAGLLADPARLTKAELDHWADTADWQMLAEYSVAGCAADSPHGWELGRRWIDSPRELTAAAGWSTLSGHVAVTPDDRLDLDALSGLLERIRDQLAGSLNRVRYTMNGFVIALGGHVQALREDALTTAAALGKVRVDMGGTACQVPDAAQYIARMVDKGVAGRKRKSARC